MIFAENQSTTDFIIHADHPQNHETSDEPTYALSICAVFSNDAYHLKQWIEHHRNLGVEHIYLYNIKSVDPFYYVLLPYLNENFITLVNWPGKLEKEEQITSMRFVAYENAINFVAKEESKWLLLLDINEFLVCPKENIFEILTHYDDFSAILLSYCLVDKKTASQTKKLDKADSDPHIFEKHSVKMIFKPKLCKGFSWPPYQCQFKEPQLLVNAETEELWIEHHINRKTKEQMVKDCIKNKIKNNQFSLISEPDASELADLENTYNHEHLDLPMYSCMPTFLKKLKCKFK